MNERNLKVLEQYELEVRNVRRGRDSYILDTDRGIVLLKEYKASMQRAAWMEKVCRTAKEAGLQTDIPIADREGNYVSSDREEKRYMVKLWTPGREMDVKNSREISEAVENLARLHTHLTGFAGEESNVLEKREQLYEKRMRELRKIWRYIKAKKQKNAFEMSFMKEYSGFMELCEKALELSGQERVQTVRNDGWEKGCVCHGDYNQHNVLKDTDHMVTVNFENCRIGIQTVDLYCFMRKILEKHNWRIELAKEMLQTYTKQRKLSEAELEDLYIQFLFPEKFWKISNRYYNSKKTWIPDRSMQKLDKIMEQSLKKKNFLEYLRDNYSL